MKYYILRLLLRHTHTHPTKRQLSPHCHVEITYCAKAQYATEPKPSPPFPAAGIKRVQEIVGSFLYYARAVDKKLLVVLNEIGSQQAAATECTNHAITQLLDYVATYTKDGIIYRASYIILGAHTDAAYLHFVKARSRVGAHTMLTKKDPFPRHNGPVLTIAQIIKYVISSAAEAELDGLFVIAKYMVPIRQTLI